MLSYYLEAVEHHSHVTILKSVSHAQTNNARLVLCGTSSIHENKPEYNNYGRQVAQCRTLRYILVARLNFYLCQTPPQYQIHCFTPIWLIKQKMLLFEMSDVALHSWSIILQL